MDVSVIGASGYSGVELVRLLQQHPFFTISSLHSSSKPGQFLHQENPHLSHSPYRLRDIDIDEIAGNSQLVFLATPSGVAKDLASKLLSAGVKVIDLSGDHRLQSQESYRKWYKKEPAEEAILGKAVYGLSEWNKEQIKEADLVANPGCFPTASLLGLAPLMVERLIRPDSVIIDAKSGVSGAGRSASVGSLYSEVNENFKIYKVHEHQHIPEIEQQLDIWQGDRTTIEFSTHLVPMTRGIMATIYAELKGEWSNDKLHGLYRETYMNHPFIRIQEQGVYPCTKQVMGSNFCDISLSINERTGRITIVSVIDNLMKGAAGQAVQNANILCGFGETDGLMQLPLFP
ncbi:N-acetyl-gamma-glutamyl-phosphate reductase [Bacillus sp. 1P06AnD]|uniref:N-acetyl-gamma-glutamyl-phosphate reductase n=1 Tax=Bacillus sp. 1P06AnD TaxID=3132208 RepID=UPI00399FE368